MDGVGFLALPREEQLVWTAIAQEAAQLQQEWRKEQAVLIINQLSKAMK